MLQPWNLPDWTITRYEIDREIKIGVGYFSDVYKGTWKGRAVAIKVLAPTTPRKLFVREAGIWRGLRHRNVLQLFGASSAVEGGMWFLVSPYLPNGTLVEYLKRVESRIAAGLEGPGSPRLGGQGSPRLGATSPRRSTAGHAKLATSPGSPIMEAGTARAGGFALPSLDDSASAHQRTMSLDRHSPMRPAGPARQDSLSVGLLRASLEAQSPSRTPSSSSSASTTPTGELIPSMPGPTPPTEGDEDPADVLRYLLEIARGMEYLHSKGVLHGDLKAANVLVDDNHHAVISDFGQSEMRSEVYRISGLGGHGHGTLRWQAPELLSGATERITTETDVYAFAITAVEVLGFGRLPWGQLDDEAVRWAVLSTIIHAIIPSHTTPVLLALLRACWARDPFKRPMFSQVVRDVKRLRKQAGWIERNEDKAFEQPPDALTNEEMIASMPSPDLKPMPLPGGMS
ncbi:kinase-like protein, partial [Schizophyllum commune Loenen D]